MFQLDSVELEHLKSQIVTPSWGGSRVAPYAFTEQGVAMLSTVPRKVGQKTVTLALSVEQFKGMKQAVQNGRRLRKTIGEMQALSRQILFATITDTRRSKPFKPKDLRLI